MVPEKILFIDSLFINFSFTLIKVSPIVLYIFFFPFLSLVKISLLYKALDNSLGRILLIKPLTS